jgi:hypothetical protein
VYTIIFEHCIQGSGGSRTVPLKEGTVNDIKIEVTSEDGTTKNYFVHVRRLSAKDAALGSLSISSGELDPPFTPDVTYYICMYISGNACTNSPISQTSSIFKSTYVANS